VRPILGLAYFDTIERRFTDAFQAVEKEVINNDRGRLQQLAGRAALCVLAGQTEAAKSAGEENRWQSKMGRLAKPSLCMDPLQA